MSCEALDPVLASVTAPLQQYLDDPRVVEIMLNHDSGLWIERLGEPMFNVENTMSPEQAAALLTIVASDNEEELTRKHCTVAGTLRHWQARVQGILPPVAERPMFTIRKPARELFPLSDYVKNGALTEADKCALEQAVLERRNILVGGGAGSGKTTFANALLQVMAKQTGDRVYIVEDRRELQCPVPNSARVRTIKGLYDMRSAIFDSLSMRPSRIVVGELRDGSAHELVSAWGTDHNGGICTIHADGTTEMLTRIARLSEQVVVNASREEIAQAVHVCVHLARTPTGRRVTGVVRVKGYDAATKSWLTEPLKKS